MIVGCFPMIFPLNYQSLPPKLGESPISGWTLTDVVHDGIFPLQPRKSSNSWALAEVAGKLPNMGKIIGKNKGNKKGGFDKWGTPKFFGFIPWESPFMEKAPYGLFGGTLKSSWFIQLAGWFGGNPMTYRTPPYKTSENQEDLGWHNLLH